MKSILIAITFFLASLGTSDDQFPWTKGRKLTWADFKGKPVKSNFAAALTFTDIQINASLIDGQLNVEVKNYFDSKLSWTKNKESTSLLAHEQLHFDITELYTRIIRKKMKEIISEEAIRNGTLNKESSKLLKEWKEFQLQYDSETNHGVLSNKQKEWEQKVQRLLEN